jgi:meso-butanediol dehydrogenase/(S,S)-butanediol dehydrogenase/diacetyl reductase
MKNIIITGASSGLGAAIARSLGHNVINWSYECGVDVQDSKSIEAAFNALSCGPIDILVNCAGVNHIDYIPDMKEEDWNLVMDTNAKGIFLVSQALLPVLKGGTILNIVSNASNIPMTGSIAYNASKGAAEIMTRQMARELKKTHDITIFGISPNKLSGTGMSEYIDKRVCEVRGWTKEEARAYQLAALPAGEETDPATLAEFIAFLLSTKERHKYLNGCIIPYGGPV